MEPLVRVLKAVNQDKKPMLCIIYEAMDRPKLTVKASVRKWEKHWEIIDNLWYQQLHRHLHAAGYFFNPVVQYSNICVFEMVEVKRGDKEVTKRLELNLIIQANAMNETATHTRLVQYEATTHKSKPAVLLGEVSTSKVKDKGARRWKRKKGKGTTVTATASTGGAPAAPKGKGQSEGWGFSAVEGK
ncbi:UNVERIFIED_CONTAM: hypothetical protein Slati_0214600 [Sesamum latifolium]|uniref:Uncharacterized protein n=1 Tax=Sesamum latifolium TaxID=2727402 RepID=A0AAW2YBP9_9LAMI